MNRQEIVAFLEAEKVEELVDKQLVRQSLVHDCRAMLIAMVMRSLRDNLY